MKRTPIPPPERRRSLRSRLRCDREVSGEEFSILDLS
jgi:hypothetical protein